MTIVARVVASLCLLFLFLFITLLVLLWFLPVRVSSTVFANPTICKVPCICKECPSGGGLAPLSASTIDGLLITYEWPDQITLNSSDTIRVNITSNAAIAASKLTATVTGNYRLAGATPEEVGTPGTSYDANGNPVKTSVNDAFGPKYQVFATAQLLAATFDVKTFDLTEQSLNQGSVSWLWDIKPNTLGSQVVGLALDLRWKPINGGQVIQHQVWQTQMPITVTQPFLDKGQLSAATIITGALASGGLITGLILLFATAGLGLLGKKRDQDKGEIAQPKSEQPKSEKENKTGVNPQEDDHVGEAKVQDAKSSVQLQQKSRELFVDIRSLLQQRSQTLSVGLRVLLIMLPLLLIGGSVLIYYAKVFRPVQLSALATARASTPPSIKSTPVGIVTEFIIPTNDSDPRGIVAGPDGNLWFAESNRIGRITPQGAITEFPLSKLAYLEDITAGPDRSLWFTACDQNTNKTACDQNTNKIGRITPQGAITEFPIPTPKVIPFEIAAGPDGNLWFTEAAFDETIGVTPFSLIGRITPQGAITEFPIPTPGYDIGFFTRGPDGNLWFKEGQSDRIGRITPQGAITEFHLSANSDPWGITAGPDGNLWFTESGPDANKIGRITPQGAITEFPIPTLKSMPFEITAGPDGNLWFTENLGDKIGRITPSGSFTEFPLPTSCGSSYGCQPSNIAAEPDGNLWFTEDAAVKIGRITPRGAITEFPISSYTSGIVAGPDGNLWFTERHLNQIGRITTGSHH